MPWGIRVCIPSRKRLGIALSNLVARPGPAPPPYNGCTEGDVQFPSLTPSLTKGVSYFEVHTCFMLSEKKSRYRVLQKNVQFAIDISLGFVLACLCLKGDTFSTFPFFFCHENGLRRLIRELQCLANCSHYWKGTVLRRAESVQNSIYLHKILYIVE